MNKSTKNKLDQILNMDYNKAKLSSEYNWYIGGLSVSPEQTQEYLKAKLPYIHEAIREASIFYSFFEDTVRHLQLKGDLYHDVMELGDLLYVSDLCANAFLEACYEINMYEMPYRHLKINKTAPVKDLPF